MSADKELVQLKKELSALKAEYRDFVYAISHDFRAPIRHIEGFSKIILEREGGNFDAKTQDYMTRITASTEKLKNMLDGLLSLSRLKTIDKENEEIDCNILVANLLQNDFKEDIDGIKVKLEIDKLPKIKGDKAQIDELFYQLLKNALTYIHDSKQQEISLSVKEKNNQVVFSLKDKGIGMNKKLIKKIYLPLQRAVHHDEYNGMGMGLTLAKKIVENHQGEITIRTNEQDGYNFEVEVALPKA